MQNSTQEAKYLDQLGLASPNLFLVMRHPRAVLKDRGWYHIRHQCAGIACHQQEFFGTPLVPRGKIALGLANISQHFYASEMGALGIILDDILEYRAMLQDLDLDCNQNFSQLREGYYPIDLPENLSEIVEDDLPEDLDDLIDWEKEPGPLAKMLGAINRWSLLWVSENSD